MATAYPFDPSGTSAANRIVNEQHVITAVNFRDYHYVVPKFAPFFAESMVLRMQYPNGNTRTLTQGLDYYYSHQFLDASRACAKPVYGSISFLDTDEAGVLSISYQTVGGIWTLSLTEISRILAESMRNPRTTAWEQITYLPERFPIVDHEWDLVDMVGASEVVRAIDDIATTLANASGGGLQSHTTNFSNPHAVTKAQVGLGNVQNYATATQTQAVAGAASNLYMTPIRTKEAISHFGQQLVDVHAFRADNPHNTTKAHVGLGSVENYPMATSAEAINASANNRYISPSTLGAAVQALVRTDFDSHVANRANPHNVTKAQVGLSFIENFPVASAEEARAGTRADRYMTPQRTTQLMAEYVNTRLMEHELRVDNPHDVNKVQVGLGNVENFAMADLSAANNPSSMSLYVSPAVAAAISEQKIQEYMTAGDNPAGVTKAQVGLANVENYLIATQVQAEEGIVSNAYMTPLRTKQAIAAQAGSIVNSHASNTSNPHSVTKAQVGLGSVENYPVATQTQAEQGTVGNAYMTPLTTKMAVSVQAGELLEVHTSNNDNPHNTTKTHVGLGSVQNYGIATPAQATEGLSNTAYMTPLQTKNAVLAFAQPLVDDHAERDDNPHGITKAQVGLSNVDNYSTATPSQAVAGLANNMFVTPAGLRSALDANSDPAVALHMSDMDNPHEVTAEQLGAVTTSQLTGELASYLKKTDTDVSGMTRAAFTEMVLDGRSADSTLWDGRTVEEHWEYLDQNRIVRSYVQSKHSDGIYLQSGGNTKRGAWVEVANLTNGSPYPDEPDEPYLGQDALYIVHGGQYWGNGYHDGKGYDNMSPVYLLRVAFGPYTFGQGSLRPMIEVTQIAGWESPDINNIEFGVVIGGLNGINFVRLFLSTTRSHRPVIVNRLTPLANTIPITTVTSEPIGIQYLTIDSKANPVVINNTLGLHNTVLTGLVNSVTDGNNARNALAQRVTNIETLLNSITVV